MGLEFGVKVGNMARDNGLCVCVVKPHGVTDKPLGEAILHTPKRETTLGRISRTSVVMTHGNFCPVQRGLDNHSTVRILCVILE